MRTRVLTIAASLCVAAGVQAADLVVIQSTDASLSPGHVIDSAEPFVVAAGAQVTLVSQSGETITLDGPHDGPVGTGDDSGDGGLVGALAALISQDAEDDTGSLGAFRALDMPEPHDPWALNLLQPGIHCLAAGLAPELWLPSLMPWSDVAIARSNEEWFEIAWPAGAETQPWPDGLPLEDGARYAARVGDMSQVEVKLRVIPEAEATPAHQVVWMAENECEGQARKLLAAMSSN
jgi:hypothetical protein